MTCVHEWRSLCIMECAPQFNHGSSMLSGDFANEKGKEKIINSLSSFVFMHFSFSQFYLLAGCWCSGFICSKCRITYDMNRRPMHNAQRSGAAVSEEKVSEISCVRSVRYLSM